MYVKIEPLLGIKSLPTISLIEIRIVSEKKVLFIAISNSSDEYVGNGIISKSYKDSVSTVG